MDDSEEKDSREDFLSHREDSQNQSEKDTSHESQDEASDENIFNLPKVVADSGQDEDAEKYNYSQNGTPSDPKQLLLPELNHLNALANLDPSSKFPESASLRDMRFPAAVTGEDETSKVFMCHLCDFKTAYANSLMNHQAVHSDVRPWACAMCEYAAKRKQDLKKHLHTVHGMMVESPMLKPILPNNPGGIPKFPGMNDGLKDQFTEGLNLKRSASSDQEFPYFPASSSAHQVFASKRIKEEFPSMDMMSPPLHERKVPSSSETDESPDDNLPICFPPSASKINDSSRSRESPLYLEGLPHLPSNRENGEIGMQFGMSAPWVSKKRDKMHESIMREWSQYNPKSREGAPFPSGLMREKGFLESVGIGAKSSSSFSRTRDDVLSHSFSEEDCTADETQNRSASNESLKPNETDRSISSSSTVIHARSTQTQSGFMCEHCDILFFQRAMYLMHVGLHSPHDPWCCAVCGHSFSEKYSFTSHFINQH